MSNERNTEARAGCSYHTDQTDRTDRLEFLDRRMRGKAVRELVELLRRTRQVPESTIARYEIAAYEIESGLDLSEIKTKFLSTKSRRRRAAKPPVDLQTAVRPLDDFVEACANLARAGKLIEGEHWAIVEGLLCLRVQTCLRVCAASGIATAEFVSISRAARINLRNDGYVWARGKVVAFGSCRARAIALDLLKMDHLAGVDVFHYGLNRTWGGNSHRFYETWAEAVGIDLPSGQPRPDRKQEFSTLH